MKDAIVLLGVPEDAKAEAATQWTRRRRQIERYLTAFAPAETSLRLAVHATLDRCEAQAVLILPTATLAATGGARTDEPTVAIDEAADRLLDELHRHKAELRRAFLYTRRRRRRGDLSGILAALTQRHGVGDRETFCAMLGPALRELSDHARRELIIAQLEGVLRPGQLTVSALMSELVARAWSGFQNRPASLRLEIWLTGLLHQILDEHGPEPTRGRHERVAGDSRYTAATGAGTDAEAFWPSPETLTLPDVLPVSQRGSAWERASDEDQRTWILSQLGRFGRMQRRAFTLYTLEGWNDDEVAAIQGRTPEEVLLDVNGVRDELTRLLEEDRP